MELFVRNEKVSGSNPLCSTCYDRLPFLTKGFVTPSPHRIHQAGLADEEVRIEIGEWGAEFFDLHPEEESELVPKILHIMETALSLPHDVPILVEKGTGKNWLAAH